MVVEKTFELRNVFLTTAKYHPILPEKMVDIYLSGVLDIQVVDLR